MSAGSRLGQLPANQLLVEIVLGILEHKREKAKNDYKTLTSTPLPSNDGFERGEQNPARGVLISRQEIAGETLRRIEDALVLLKGGSGSSFVCDQICGTLIAGKVICNFYNSKKEENASLAEILCLNCDRAKTPNNRKK